MQDYEEFARMAKLYTSIHAVNRRGNDENAHAKPMSPYSTAKGLKEGLVVRERSRELEKAQKNQVFGEQSLTQQKP